MSPAATDLTDRRFGRLVAKVREGQRHGFAVWRCQCDCGAFPTIKSVSLTSGRTRSCGCLAREMAAKRLTTHGMCGTKIHQVWRGMLQRCGDPNYPRYADHGGRGITICDRWRSFDAFYADMGDVPPGLSIDRIDNNGNYEPGNCRWATAKTQNANKRNTKMVTLDGKTQTVADWCRHFGVSPSAVCRREQRGWPVERWFEPGRKP
jgi:hypothetical protein